MRDVDVDGKKERKERGQCDESGIDMLKNAPSFAIFYWFSSSSILASIKLRDEFNVVATQLFFYRSRYGSVDKIALEIDEGEKRK